MVNLGKLKEIKDLRKVWLHEALDFTPWLAEEDNLALLADAVGLGLDVKNSPGIFIVNFGGETTELSVLASGGMVLNRILKIGGNTLDQSIVSNIRYNKDFLIGRVTAENLRKHFGIGEHEAEKVLNVSGRNLVSGIPETQDIPASMVYAAIKEKLVARLKWLQRTM